MRKVLLSLMVLFALAGCAALADLGDLRKDIEAEGYDVSGVSHNTTNGHAVLTVQAVTADELPTDDDAAKIAEVVWTKYAGEFDELVVGINDRLMLDATQDELTERFGERPASLGDAADSGGGANVTLIVVVVAVALVFTGLMVLLWRRGRRPPPPNAPPGQPPVYPPHPGMPPRQQYPG